MLSGACTQLQYSGRESKKLSWVTACVSMWHIVRVKLPTPLLAEIGTMRAQRKHRAWTIRTSWTILHARKPRRRARGTHAGMSGPTHRRWSMLIVVPGGGCKSILSAPALPASTGSGGETPEVHENGRGGAQVCAGAFTGRKVGGGGNDATTHTKLQQGASEGGAGARKQVLPHLSAPLPRT
jgi:hypothetical protein